MKLSSLKKHLASYRLGMQKIQRTTSFPTPLSDPFNYYYQYNALSASFLFNTHFSTICKYLFRDQDLSSCMASSQLWTCTLPAEISVACRFASGKPISSTSSQSKYLPHSLEMSCIQIPQEAAVASCTKNKLESTSLDEVHSDF